MTQPPGPATNSVTIDVPLLQKTAQDLRTDVTGLTPPAVFESALEWNVDLATENVLPDAVVTADLMSKWQIVIRGFYKNTTAAFLNAVVYMEDAARVLPGHDLNSSAEITELITPVLADANRQYPLGNG